MTSDTTPIVVSTELWMEGWCTRDHKRLLALWDDTDAHGKYLPADSAAPLIGGASVAAYIQTICKTFETIRHQLAKPVYRRLSENTASVFYALNWMRKDPQGVLGGTCRVTALWRQTGTTWRMFHYAEAPLAPLLELQAFYEQIAEDGLDAIPARAPET